MTAHNVSSVWKDRALAAEAEVVRLRDERDEALRQSALINLDRVEELREVVRLREALREISEMTEDCDELSGGWLVGEKARTALREGVSEPTGASASRVDPGSVSPPKTMTVTSGGSLTSPVDAEKLVRDCFTYLPHRVAGRGEKYGLLARKLSEEVEEASAAAIGSPAFVSELGDIVEVCYALGGKDAVENARAAKFAERGGFDRLLVMRLEDRTDYPPLTSPVDTAPRGYVEHGPGGPQAVYHAETPDAYLEHGDRP